MAEAGEGDGAVVLGEHQVVVRGEVHRRLVVDVGVRPRETDFHLVVDAAVVDGDELLVQVVERGAGRLQPVLEDGDVADVAVGEIDVAHRVDGEAEVLVVLVGGERAGRAELAVVVRPGRRSGAG